MIPKIIDMTSINYDYMKVIDQRRAIDFKIEFKEQLANDNIEIIKEMIENNNNMNYYFQYTVPIINMLIFQKRYDIVKFIYEKNTIEFVRNCKKFNIDYKEMLKKVGEV